MLPSKNRLTKRSDFQRIFKNGQRNFNKFLNIRYVINNLANSRVAVVVSTKVSKKAIARNKIKRQVRAIIHVFLPKFRQKYDIIINVLSPSLKQEYSAIEEELLKILKKSNIL